MKNTENLKIENIETSILIPYARNSRTHSDAQVQQIADSIKEFGFTNPILIDETNGIIAGHGRLQAAQLLQILEIPCIRLLHLTDNQKKAYVIADNKIAMNADWDLELLKLELKDLSIDNFNLEITGFSDDELSIHLDEKEFDMGTVEDQGQLDKLDPKYVKCPECSYKFDAREHEA